MWMLGIGLMFVGGMALLMMHVTQVIPYRGGTHRHEDPEAFDRWWLIYGAGAATGLVFTLFGWLLS